MILSHVKVQYLSSCDHNLTGDRGSTDLQHRRCATNRKVAGSIPAVISGIFINIKFFRSHYGSGVDSASNRNAYQEYFLGAKRPVRKADNLLPFCAVVAKSGNLNFLRILWACPGLQWEFFTFLQFDDGKNLKHPRLG